MVNALAGNAADIDRQEKRCSTLVDLSAMGNTRHFNSLILVIDGVDHPVVADPDAPFINAARKFPASLRPRIDPKFLNPGDNPCYSCGRKSLQFLFCAGGQCKAIASHVVCQT